MAHFGSVDAQKQWLSDLLQQLHVLIKDLSPSLPTGAKDGPIAKNFGSREFDKSEGPYSLSTRPGNELSRFQMKKR